MNSTELTDLMKAAAREGLRGISLRRGQLYRAGQPLEPGQLQAELQATAPRPVTPQYTDLIPVGLFEPSSRQPIGLHFEDLFRQTSAPPVGQPFQAICPAPLAPWEDEPEEHFPEEDQSEVLLALALRDAHGSAFG